MRYVSEVVSDSGPVEGVGHLNLRPEQMKVKLVSATVHDTETGESVVYKDRSVLNENCIGCCKIRDIVVAHSFKSAMLHSYVANAETIECKPGFDIAMMDTAHLASGATCISGFKDIAVSMSDAYVRITGAQGSVVAYQATNGGTFVYMTLYDLLGKLCRALEVNMMSYERIFLYSNPRYYFAQIDLRHTKESDRFFTKMYLDVGRKKKIVGNYAYQIMW